MRHSSAIYLALLAASFGLSACGGSSGIDDPRSIDAPPSHGYQDWQPQRSMDRVQPLALGLEQASGQRAGGIEVLVLDAFNRPDSAVQASLKLQRTGDELSISSTSESLGSAYLYLRSNGSEHVASVEFGAEALVAISVPVDAGTQALGLSAGNKSFTPGSTLAVVHLADGPALVQRRADAIDAVNNRVGLVDQQKLTAQDNGEAAATLSWRERLTGDYDINGEVNIADITPVGINFNKSYDKENPDASPKIEVADGDFNGLITLADITPIGQNFSTRIIGYDVYRTALSSPDEDPVADVSDSRWQKIENQSDPGLPSASRGDVPNNGTRLTYTFLDDEIPDGGGNYAWAVVPIAAANQTPHQGPVSNIAKSGVLPKGAPVDLVFEDPANGSLTVGDEFWISVRVGSVFGLFSANMRLEYDSSLLEVVEVDSADQILPDYVDGAFSGTNMLTDPLFLGIDNVGTADNPYVLLGFNDTQKQGTPAVDGSGAVGFVKFRAIASGANSTAIRWPQSSTFILLWGEEFGVPAVAPILGSPLDVTVSPAG